MDLENFKDKEGYYCFHAGTKFDEDGQIVTNGGRVAGRYSQRATDLKEAQSKCLCGNRVDRLSQINICAMILEKQLTKHN